MKIPETLTIELTVEDVAQGERHNPYRNPFALAVKRALEYAGHKVQSVASGRQTFLVHLKADSCLYATPPEVAAIMEAFEVGDSHLLKTGVFKLVRYA